MPYFTFIGALHIQHPDYTVDLAIEQHEKYLDYLKGCSTDTAEECVRFHLGMLATEPRSETTIETY